MVETSYAVGHRWWMNPATNEGSVKQHTYLSFFLCIDICVYISVLSSRKKLKLRPPRQDLGARRFRLIFRCMRCIVTYLLGLMAQVVYWNKVQHLMFLLLISVVYVHINNIFVFLFNLFINYFTSEGLVRVLKSHRVIGRIETCHLFLKLRIALRRSGSLQSRTLLGSRLARWPWMPNHRL